MKNAFLVCLILSFNTLLLGQTCHSVYFDGIDDGLDLQLPIIEKEAFGYEFDSEFSFDFWIKTQHPTYQEGTVFSFSGQHTFPGCNNITININSFGYLSVNLTLSTQTLGPIFSDNPINDGSWHHVVFTRNNENTLRLFVDGQLNYTSNGPVFGLLNLNTLTDCNFNSNQKNTIGYFFATEPTNFLQGFLDNLRIWDVSLTVDHVTQLVNNCALNTIQPIFDLQFDEIENQGYNDFDNGFYTQNNGSSVSDDTPLCCDCNITVSDSLVCKGNEIQLVSNSNYDALWPNDAISSIFTLTVDSDTSINVQFMDNQNVMCEDSVSLYALVPQVPTIHSLGNSLVCSESTFYQWYFNGFPLENEYSQILQNVSNGNYSVFTIDNNGCSAFSEILPIDFTASWDCVNNQCVDLGNGNGIYVSLQNCQNSCLTNSSIKQHKFDKQLIKVINIYGVETSSVENSPLFYIYDDGTVEKKLFIHTY